MIRRLRALAVLTLSRGVVIVIQTISVGAQARSLGVAQFGAFASIQAVGFLVMAGLDFGLTSRALRVGAEDARGAGRAILLLRLLTIFPLGVVTLTLFVFTDRPRTLILGSLLFVASEAVGDVVSALWLGRRQHNRAMACLILRRVALAAPFLWGLGYAQFATGLYLAAVVSGICYLLAVRSEERGGANVCSIARSSFGFWGATAATSIQKFDVLIVNALGGGALAGLYGGAIRFSNALNTGTSILLQYSIPDISHAPDYIEKRRRHRRLMRMIAAYGAVLAVGIFAAKPISYVLLGPAFNAGWPLMSAIFASAAISAFGQGYLAWHVVSGVTPKLALRIAVATVINLIMIGFGAALGIAPLALLLVGGNVMILAVIAMSRASRPAIESQPKAAA